MAPDEIDAALEAFATDIAKDAKGDARFVALQALAQRLIGARLFTIMAVDMKNGVYRRQFSSHPETYPAAGTKPIEYNRWFDTICKERKTFIANTIAEIATVFRDHETSWSLGCGSVINLPVIVDGELLGTVNCQDVEHNYTPEKVALSKHLDIPAKLAFTLAKGI